MKDFREQNYYELLDVPVYAPPAAIEMAYRRAAATFNADSVAVYALFPPEDLSLLRRRIEEAWAVLGDPERRRAYDLDLGIPPRPVSAEPEPPPENPPPALGVPIPPENVPAPAGAVEEPLPRVEAPAQAPLPPAPPPQDAGPAAPLDLAPCPRMPEIGPDTVFDGHLLRQIRQARGLSLEKVADKTKINIYYLRNIEEDKYKELPAPVYTRGYLRLLAAALKLDPERVVRTYLENMKKAGG